MVCAAGGVGVWLRGGLYLRDPAHPGFYQHFTYRDYRLVRESPGALSAVLAHEFTTVAVGEGAISRKAFVSLVSSSYFATLASRPASS